MNASTTVPVKRRSRLAVAAVLLLLAGNAWFFWPRQVDVREFDPGKVAAGEAAMWRHYYERDRARLAWDTYTVMREAFGFSPFMTVRMAMHAGLASNQYQGNQDAGRQLKAEAHLREYYYLLAEAVPDLQPDEAARLEIQWWWEHRQRQYGDCARTVALLNAQLFGKDADRFAESSRLRVEAMRLCDVRTREEAVPVEWEEIHAVLLDSYETLLREAAPEPGE